jgi:CelD/BcsL family acetyltransferase involved in cellulose biosynthesis
MENWLACLPRDEAPQLAIVKDRGAPVAACFVRRRFLRRNRFVPSRALFVNATGKFSFDDICLEHNGLLATKQSGVSLATLVQLLPGAWDEVYVLAGAVETFDALTPDVLGPDLRVCVDRQVANYQIDLAKVREHGYIPQLGSSTRAQVRKAQRAAGKVTFEVARDVKQANDIYGELVTLHQRSWQSRGQPGAFADPWFDAFHRRLIEKRIAHGEIQLIRVRNDELTIGCLYNFVSGGRVLFYQCGFGAPDDRHLRPGYLCHTHAVEHSAGEGHAVYDLLGGDARYKQSLATDETRLVWGRVQRRRPWFALEDRLRTWLKR